MRIIIYSVLCSLLVTVLALNTPASWWNVSKYFPQYGTAFSQLTSADQLSAFPTTYNANLALTANISAANSFTALNQFTNASSSLSSCYGPCYFGGSATSSFARTGALTLITPLGIASGGTASTTLSANQVLVGNGTSQLKTVDGWGTSGQFLQSNGTGAQPTWASASVNLNDNYVWAGTHTFNNTVDIEGSATYPFTVNTQAYKWPTTDGTASSTALMTDGSGQLVWQLPAVSTLFISPYVNVATAQTSTTTLKSLTIPANTLNTTDKSIHIHAAMIVEGTANCYVDVGYGNGSATSSIGYNNMNANTLGAIDVILSATSSTNQYATALGTAMTNIADPNYPTPVVIPSSGYATVNIAAQQFISIGAKTNVDSTCRLLNTTITVNGV